MLLHCCEKSGGNYRETFGDDRSGDSRKPNVVMMEDTIAAMILVAVDTAGL
jgi:hypothetical protein